MKTVTRAKGWIAAQVKSVLKSVNAQTADGAGNISLTTDNVPEGPTNKYFTVASAKAAAIAAVLTGVDVTLAGTVLATDTVLAAFGKLQKQINAWIALKDASGGFAGLTLFQINFRNAANTFTSFLTNLNTAVRTYTFPDKDGTVAMLSDITVTGSMALLGQVTVGTAVARIDFLNIFTSAYDKYVVEIQQLRPSNTQDTPCLRFASAGVPITVSYGNTAAHGGTQTIGNQWSVLSPSAGDYFTLTLELRNINQAGGYQGVGVLGFFNDTVAAVFKAILMEGLYYGGSAISGFTLRLVGGGNIQAATVRVYGIKNS